MLGTTIVLKNYESEGETCGSLTVRRRNIWKVKRQKTKHKESNMSEGQTLEGQVVEGETSKCHVCVITCSKISNNGNQLM